MKTPLLLAALAALTLAAPAQQLQISKDNKTIAITTSDDASAPADTAVVTIGFQSFGPDQDTTYAQASKTSNAIVAALTSAGIPKDAIESTEQNLSALGPDGDENKARYATGIRFQFNQGWRVTVPAAEAAHVLQLAIPAGANQSGNIDWQLKHDDALQAEAATKALAHAREIAAAMAKGLGVKLTGLVYASNQTPPSGIVRPFFAMNALQANSAEAAEARLKTAPLAITAQRITRSATVYAVFSIE